MAPPCKALNFKGRQQPITGRKTLESQREEDAVGKSSHLTKKHVQQEKNDSNILKFTKNDTGMKNDKKNYDEKKTKNLLRVSDYATSKASKRRPLKK